MRPVTACGLTVPTGVCRTSEVELKRPSESGGAQGVGLAQRNRNYCATALSDGLFNKPSLVRQTPVGTVRPQAVTVRMRIKQNVPYSDKSETRVYPCVRLRCANRTYAAMPHAGGNAAMRALCGGGC